jgi:hypothetical protein
MGFEPTIPAFKLAKTVHALDGAAAVIGSLSLSGWHKINVTIKEMHFHSEYYHSL